MVASFALLLLAGVPPVGAQQRVEIRRTQRGAEPADSTERVLRKLQRQLDSLTRIYNEDDQLNAAQRRRVEAELTRTVDRLEEVSLRMSGGMLAPAPSIGIRMAPLAAERAAASMSRALMQVREAEQAMPRGWIGIVAQGPGLEPRIEGGELIVRYFSYPRIVSVDPSSPAQRAGVATNDTLLAYNGSDVRENEISLTRLLRPNARVMVRVLRDGRTHDIPVTVASAPSRIVARRDDEVRVAREPWTVVGVPEAPSFPRLMPAAPQVSAMRGSVRVSATAPTPANPAPAGSPRVFLGFSNAGVAGAQLTTITEGLAQAIGVSSGVLVTSAPVGSPAFDSGLRDGDVIAKVGGQLVRSVSDVRDLVGLASNEGHSVDVDIVRQKRAQRIVLKW